MPGIHAPIAISSLGLTVACHASVSLQATVPELPETPEEAEGTAGDLIATWAAQGRLLDVGTKFDSGGRTWEVSIDMHNGARLWTETMHNGTQGALRLQDGVRATAIHPEHCWGTPDAWEYFPKGTGPQAKPVLRVGDYKFGHRFVEVFENWQLIGYAVAVIERLNLNDNDLILELILCQPRAYRPGESAVRVWRVPAVEIRALINIAMSAAHAALAPNPTATTGNHCLDCRARHACKALRYSTASIIDFSMTAELLRLDPVSMGQELRILRAAMRRLEARETGLAAQVEATIRAGERVPFFNLEPKRSNLQWREDVGIEERLALGTLCNIDIRKPTDTFTPRQAIDAGIDERVILQYAHRPPGALALKEDDPKATRKVISQQVSRT
jgi:uncharacterized protein DUF2800